MNRREALAAAAATLSGIGLSTAVSAVEVAPQTDLIAFKLRFNGKLSMDAVARLRAEIKNLFASTDYANTPILICDDGVDFEAVVPESAGLAEVRASLERIEQRLTDQEDRRLQAAELQARISQGRDVHSIAPS